VQNLGSDLVVQTPNTKHIVSELQRLVLLQHQVSPSIGEGEGSEGKEKGVKSADLGVAN